MLAKLIIGKKVNDNNTAGREEGGGGNETNSIDVAINTRSSSARRTFCWIHSWCSPAGSATVYLYIYIYISTGMKWCLWLVFPARSNELSNYRATSHHQQLGVLLKSDFTAGKMWNYLKERHLFFSFVRKKKHRSYTLINSINLCKTSRTRFSLHFKIYDVCVCIYINIWLVLFLKERKKKKSNLWNTFKHNFVKSREKWIRLLTDRSGE